MIRTCNICEQSWEGDTDTLCVFCGSNDTREGIDDGVIQQSMFGSATETKIPDPRSAKGQCATLLHTLLDGPTCGTTFLSMHIPRYAARVYDLRQLGYLIGSRRCEDPAHRHKTRQIEYLLEGRP